MTAWLKIHRVAIVMIIGMIAAAIAFSIILEKTNFFKTDILQEETDCFELEDIDEFEVCLNNKGIDAGGDFLVLDTGFQCDSEDDSENCEALQQKLEACIKAKKTDCFEEKQALIAEIQTSSPISVNQPIPSPSVPVDNVSSAPSISAGGPSSSASSSSSASGPGAGGAFIANEIKMSETKSSAATPLNRLTTSISIQTKANAISKIPLTDAIKQQGIVEWKLTTKKREKILAEIEILKSLPFPALPKNQEAMKIVAIKTTASSLKKSVLTLKLNKDEMKGKTQKSLAVQTLEKGKWKNLKVASFKKARDGSAYVKISTSNIPPIIVVTVKKR